MKKRHQQYDPTWQVRPKWAHPHHEGHQKKYEAAVQYLRRHEKWVLDVVQPKRNVIQLKGN